MWSKNESSGWETQVHSSQLGTADLILAMEWLYEAIVWEVVLLLKRGEFFFFFLPYLTGL